MKISHTVLETCRTNPTLWATSQLDSGSRASFGFNAALLCAIHDFHKGLGNEKQSIQRLSEMLDKNFKDQKRIDSTMLNLQKYLDWFSGQNIQVADSRFSIKQSFGSLWDLVGLIHRLDITDDGYRAVILTEPYSFWHKELRMPLIQEAVASKYGRPVSEVSVGVQDLTGAGLVTRHFGVKSTAKAVEEFSKLGFTVNGILGPKSN